jgi:hypothetical protein
MSATMAQYFQPRPVQVGQQQQVSLVARYGRIYKRKAPDLLRLKDRGQLKTAPGMRLCRVCKCYQPLDKFYSNSKRYICKMHHYERARCRAEVRHKEYPYEKLAWKAWAQLHALCPYMGYTHVNYDRHDMMDLMVKTKIPMTCRPRVVPIDPRVPLRPRNVAIITEESLLVLMKLLKRTVSAAQFILFVQSCNLVPANADVGRPWDPFHDPNYKRVDIDVVPILQAENECPVQERPYLEMIRQAMEENRSRRMKRVKALQEKTKRMMLRDGEANKPKRGRPAIVQLHKLPPREGLAESL